MWCLSTYAKLYIYIKFRQYKNDKSVNKTNEDILKPTQYADRQTDRQTGHADRQTGKSDRQTYRQTDGQGRQTDKQGRHTHIHLPVFHTLKTVMRGEKKR